MNTFNIPCQQLAGFKLTFKEAISLIIIMI